MACIPADFAPEWPENLLVGLDFGNEMCYDISRAMRSRRG